MTRILARNAGPNGKAKTTVILISPRYQWKTGSAQRTRVGRHTERPATIALREPESCMRGRFADDRGKARKPSEETVHGDRQKSDMWKPFFMFMLVV